MAIDAAVDFLLKGNRTLKEIRFVLFSEADYKIYEDAFSKIEMPIA